MSELYKSKPLGHDDTSGFEFVKEILDGDPTAGINFDRLQRHPTKGYIIFEWLLCDEKQQVTPYSSHPKNYWDTELFYHLYHFFTHKFFLKQKVLTACRIYMVSQ